MPTVIKKRLLFLSHRLPYPPHNGASIRTFNILKQLAREFEITALCFDRNDPATGGMPLAERMEALAPYASVEVFPIPQEHSTWRKILDHTRSVLTLRPYTYYMHDSAGFGRRLRYHLAQGYDLVHLDSLDLVRWVPSLRHLPTICTHHNVESALLQRRAGAEPWHRAVYMRLQGRLLRKAERHFMSQMALNIAVSDTDEAELRRIDPDLRIAVIPNGVDIDAFRPGSEGTSGCVFVGGTTWFPNKDGLRWFAESVLPELIRQGWNEEVVWVGRATDDEIARYRPAGIRLTGYVEDIRPYVQEALCFIVPLRVGGGTRLKVLDAWAMGKAVVSTPIGSEGLDARHEINVLLAETPTQFAAAILRVLADGELRTRLGRAARETAVRLYSWEGLGARIRTLYVEAAGRTPPAAPVPAGVQVVAEGRTG